MLSGDFKYACNPKTRLKGTAAVLALSLLSAPAIAGDDMQAIIDIHTGWTWVDDVEGWTKDDPDQPIIGGSALVLIPGSNGWDTQLDIVGHGSFLENGDSDIDDTYGASFTGAVHLSRRDSTNSLFGVFGGAGVASAGEDENVNVFMAGVEAQKYLNAVTIYGQAGWFTNGIEEDGCCDGADGIENGWFVRGVWRQFPTDSSKFEAEFTYAQADVDPFSESAPFHDDDHLMAWGVKYERDYGAKDMSWYLAYKGTQGEEQDEMKEYIDHTVEVGITMRFGAGSQKRADRYGPNLDTPWAIPRWSGYAIEVID